jgi:NAD(P)H-quinone oxidoreductase subunit 6
MHNAFLFFMVGLVLFSAIGILVARRITVAAFSLFLFLLGIAGIYACLSFHTALVAQILIYVGGVMVLVAFALYLYKEPDLKPAFYEVRQALGKATLFLPLLVLCYYYLPWKPLIQWAERQNPDHLAESDKSLWATGQILATQYVIEFEWIGIMMLAALITAGWFIKNDSEYIDRY